MWAKETKQKAFEFATQGEIERKAERKSRRRRERERADTDKRGVVRTDTSPSVDSAGGRGDEEGACHGKRETRGGENSCVFSFRYKGVGRRGEL